jgi:hypothetical protein
MLRWASLAGSSPVYLTVTLLFQVINAERRGDYLGKTVQVSSTLQLGNNNPRDAKCAYR